MEIQEIKKLKKNLPRFACESCDFKCYMKCDWSRHITTAKHIHSKAGNEMETKKLKKTYFCDCGKLFLSNSGLWKHKKVCNEDKINKNDISNKDISNKDISDKELIMMLLKQNSQLIEQNRTHNTNYNSHNTNYNSNNKTFNLQFFLNETCKDAMNIMDFVDSIKLQLADLEKVGEVGYVEGITNIINKNLKALDVTQRPVHCTDKKREVLYIKDENKWEKENEDKTKMRKAIKHIAYKNSKLIPTFREKYPDCGKSISKYSDKFNKIVIEAMGGQGDNDTEKENKIIANISKIVTIHKENEIKDLH
jgi:hypothetical protein